MRRVLICKRSILLVVGRMTMMHMSTSTRVPNVTTVSTVKLSRLTTVGVSDTVALPTRAAAEVVVSAMTTSEVSWLITVCVSMMGTMAEFTLAGSALATSTESHHSAHAKLAVVDCTGIRKQAK